MCLASKAARACDWIGNCIQKWMLDPFYYARVYTMCGIVWGAIRLTGFELTFSSVKDRIVPNRNFTDLNLEAAEDLEGLLAHAKSQVTEASARRIVVTDKCKTLFTFNTALLALIAIFPTKTADLLAWEIWLFFLSVVAFVVSLLVVWTYFDVGGEIVIPMQQDLIGLDKDNLKKALINENLRCAAEMDNRTDFLVDLYRTSRFFLMCGFVLLFIVFSHSYFLRAPELLNASEPTKVIRVK